ncbi:hypothetical protein E1292_04785 [Nonomuraea deserti]|uniref:Uncharacterized protein n=1 Tax=Nonomuraea deserti TaxID=1848322 RepID=A0A4V2YCI0_9ACTN|nr:hypothetical protein [Nonomuraea deserti]TDD11536.1 hypothetical protein E1292_04785 [Nonomuraea deserti]
MSTVGAIVGAFDGGSVLLALDSGLFLLIEGAIQALFVVTFVRNHRHWFSRRRSAPASPEPGGLTSGEA